MNVLMLLMVATTMSLTESLEACTAQVPLPAPAPAVAATDESVASPFDALIDLAWRSAIAVPLNPHAKTRARLQESVVDACLDRADPQRALAWIDAIENWRRGAVYADYAFRCAKAGSHDEARRALAVALEIAKLPPDANPQDWQRDRILSGVARALLVLGDREPAARLELGLSESESGRSGIVLAGQLPVEELDAQLAILDPILLNGTLDQVRHALATLTELFDRFYADDERRGSIESRIDSVQRKLPVDLRIDASLRMAAAAVAHDARPRALALLEDAQRALDAAHWTPELLVPLLARLAVARHGAGDATRARFDLDAALAHFHADHARIVNIDRADALRPVAEGYAALGDRAAALAVYRLAVEAGVENPNSRPRAEDLVLTLLSLASHAVEPDAPLLDRLRKIHELLGDPW